MSNSLHYFQNVRFTSIRSSKRLLRLRAQPMLYQHINKTESTFKVISTFEFLTALGLIALSKEKNIFIMGLGSRDDLHGPFFFPCNVGGLSKEEHIIPHGVEVGQYVLCPFYFIVGSHYDKLIN